MYSAAEWNGIQPNGSTAAHRIPLRVTVLLTCAFSIVGSTLIVLSYVCFKDSRSRARQILMHLSVVNLGAGLSYFLGGVIYFQFNYEEVELFEGDGKAVVPDTGLRFSLLRSQFNSVVRHASGAPVLCPDRLHRRHAPPQTVLLSRLRATRPLRGLVSLHAQVGIQQAPGQL